MQEASHGRGPSGGRPPVGAPPRGTRHDVPGPGGAHADRARIVQARDRHARAPPASGGPAARRSSARPTTDPRPMTPPRRAKRPASGPGSAPDAAPRTVARAALAPVARGVRIACAAAAVALGAAGCFGDEGGGDEGGERFRGPGAAATADIGRPDIVVVVSDDMRWDLTSAKGHPFLDTPELDRLAGDGMSMDNAFVPSAVCSPSRAAILTGREPFRASAPRIVWRNNSFLETQRTFVEDLQDAGYETAYFGKWHLGDGATPKRGFDHWESFDWLGDFFDPTIVVNGEPMEFDGYVDDVLAARVDAFMASRRDSDKPVFAMVGLKAPHLMFEHPGRHDRAFRGETIPVPSTYEEDFAESGKLASIHDWLGIENFRDGLPHYGTRDNYIKTHYRAILGIDDSIGSLRAALRHRGREDETLFVYTSDNGYSLGDHGLTEKHFVYEEPIRVPLLIDFPGDHAGTGTSDALVSVLDIAPTVLDYAGVEVPERIDGRSLRALAEADEAGAPVPADWRDEVFLMYEKAQVAVRTAEHKLIRSLEVPGHVELYDLVADPKETRTVHADPAYAGTLDAMQARLDALVLENGWSPRRTFRPARALVSDPVPTADAAALADAVSAGPAPVPGETDANGIAWRLVERDPDEPFALAGDGGVGPDESVLTALPIERLTDWDPFTVITMRPAERAALHVGGALRSDNLESRPIDAFNPPLAARETLAVMRFDGAAELAPPLGIEAPADTLRLPLEGRHLGDDPDRFADAPDPDGTP